MAAVSVTVLGCSGSYPGPGSACSSYLVRAGGKNIVLDLGNGSMANLQRHLAFDDLDAVILSHSHPDHWADVTGLRVALEYSVAREGLPVYGTRETRELVKATTHGFDPTFDWRLTGDGDEVEVGDLRLTFSATDHYVETLAVRIDDPASARSLAYSADTGPDWSFRHLGPDLDLALCESTFPTEAEAEGVLHLSAAQAGRMAAESRVRRLVLTHLWPGSDPDQHRRIGGEAFGRAVEIAAIDERYDL